MRLADGVLLVVDAAEGTMVVTEKVVKQALAEGLPITLLLTKVRLLMCPHPAGIAQGAWGLPSRAKACAARGVSSSSFLRPTHSRTWHLPRGLGRPGAVNISKYMPSHELASARLGMQHAP